MVTIRCKDQTFENVELICFDKDGTVLTFDHYIPIMERRAEYLVERFNLSKDNYNQLISLMGLDPETHKVIVGGPIHIERIENIRQTRDYLRNFSINSSIEEIAEIYDEVDNLVDLSHNVKTQSGSRKILESLRNANAKNLLVTHDSTEPAKKQLMSVGLFDLFDLILGLDMNSPYLSKPAPDMLQYGCKLLDIDVSKTIVVGDDDRDMLMGKNAGAFGSIGVLTGRSKEKEFKHADVIVSSIDDIIVS
ncbi:MAG: HAD family hydrolase [Candidatus Heimdallarchaeaceae archaeon]|jgi:phosphoglycolate phosphatase